MLLFLGRRSEMPYSGRADLVLGIVAAATVGATALWYFENWALIVRHFVNATSDEVALHYGSPVELTRKLCVLVRCTAGGCVVELTALHRTFCPSPKRVWHSGDTPV